MFLIWMSLTKSTDEVLSLAEGVRLRKEYFGGLAFDTRNGNIIELDGDYRLLRGSLNFTGMKN